MAGRFDRFTERARRVMTLANEEAARFNHNYIGTEHILLGLVREGDGVAAKVLSNLGVELAVVRNRVEFIIGRGERRVTGEIGLTPRAKKVIELAVDEARRFGHHYIGTEHLLLGLIREGEGIAAGVLENLGVNLERARADVIAVLVQIGSAPFHEEQVEAPHVSPRSGTQFTQYDYLIATVQRTSDMPLVIAVHGQEGIFEPGSDGFRLLTILRRLGADGWDLAGIDNGSAGGPSTYVFKRPKHS